MAEQGYSGVQPTKMAVQRLIKNPDGSISLVYIDLNNFAQIEDPAGYDVINQSNNTVEVTSDGTPEGEVIATEGAKPGTPVNVSKPSQGVPSTPSPSYVPKSVPQQKAQITPVSQTSKMSPVNVSQNVKPNTPQGSMIAPTPPTSMRPNNISYANIGRNRPNPVSSQHESFLSGLAKDVIGPGSTVNVTSGDVNPDQPGWSADNHKYSKSHRHTDEMGADVQFSNPRTGRVETNKVAIGDIAMAAAARNPKVGLGFGPNYMGPETMHIDQAGLGGVWGGGFSPEQLGNISFARETGIGPTPTYGAPTPEGFAAMAPTATGDFNDQSYARQTIDQNLNRDVQHENIADASPAKMASMGFVSRTPGEIGSIARTLAGELSGKQLRSLAKGDETASRELANMVTSIENRAASTMFGSLDKALTGSQYNSLLGSNAAVTNANYAKYGDVLSSKIQGFYNGSLTPDNYGVTSYHNPSISNPSWSGAMSAVSTTGDHKFGSLGEYGPSQGFMNDRAGMAKAQSESVRGFTPGQDYSGGGWSPSPNRDSPSEKSGIGRGSPMASKGYSALGGLNSPGEGKGKGPGKSSPSTSNYGGGKNADGSSNGWGGRKGSI